MLITYFWQHANTLSQRHYFCPLPLYMLALNTKLCNTCNMIFSLLTLNSKGRRYDLFFPKLPNIHTSFTTWIQTYFRKSTLSGNLNVMGYRQFINTSLYTKYNINYHLKASTAIEGTFTCILHLILLQFVHFLLREPFKMQPSLSLKLYMYNKML